MQPRDRSQEPDGEIRYAFSPFPKTLQQTGTTAKLIQFGGSDSVDHQVAILVQNPDLRGCCSQESGGRQRAVSHSPDTGRHRLGIPGEGGRGNKAGMRTCGAFTGRVGRLIGPRLNEEKFSSLPNFDMLFFFIDF